MELQDNHGRSFTKREDLDSICLNFYKNFYQYKEVSEDALKEVLEDLLVTFMVSMNE